MHKRDAKERLSLVALSTFFAICVMGTFSRSVWAEDAKRLGPGPGIETPWGAGPEVTESSVSVPADGAPADSIPVAVGDPAMSSQLTFSETDGGYERPPAPILFVTASRVFHEQIGTSPHMKPAASRKAEAPVVAAAAASGESASSSARDSIALLSSENATLATNITAPPPLSFAADPELRGDRKLLNEIEEEEASSSSSPVKSRDDASLATKRLLSSVQKKNR